MQYIEETNFDEIIDYLSNKYPFIQEHKEKCLNFFIECFNDKSKYQNDAKKFLTSISIELIWNDNIPNIEDAIKLIESINNSMFIYYHKNSLGEFSVIKNCKNIYGKEITDILSDFNFLLLHHFFPSIIKYNKFINLLLIKIMRIHFMMTLSLILEKIYLAIMSNDITLLVIDN